MLTNWLMKYNWKLRNVFFKNPYDQKYIFRDILRVKKKYRILSKKYRNPYFRGESYIRWLTGRQVYWKRAYAYAYSRTNKPLSRETRLASYFSRVYGFKYHFYRVLPISRQPAYRHIGLLRFPILHPWGKKHKYFFRFMWILKFFIKNKKEMLWFNLDCDEKDPVFPEAIWDINKRIMRQLAELKAEAEAMAKEAAIQESLTDNQRMRLKVLDDLPKGKYKITSYIVDSDLDPFPYSHKFNVFTGTSDIYFWHSYDTRWYEAIEMYKHQNIERKLMRREVFNAMYDGLRDKLEDWDATLKFGALSHYRGFWSTRDLVLIRQPNWKEFKKPLFDRYLQNYTTIYNWYYQPKLAENYKKIVYGLIGPTMKPHWSLLFTINRTRKNLYFTVSDMVGKVLLTVSAGSLGLHYRKRRSPQALEPLYKKVIACFRKLKVKSVVIILKVRASYLYTYAARHFRRNKIRVRALVDRFKVAHNGIKPRKKKRL